uniref:Uncharacterized protein n=1 Tax=Marseillevirus sp. TaxID=2809551 RepID=A0AA96EJV9_9VIRU|nr:hypothetical protein MarFTMF_124 [Marseillevirus sp.]
MEEFFDDSSLVAFCANGETPVFLEQRKKNTLTVYKLNSWKRKGKKSSLQMKGVNVLLDGIHSNLYTCERFPHCKRLFVKKCEKNFFYHEVGTTNFPKLKELWIGSHPCEPKIFFERFPKIFITTEYARYAKRWAPKDCNYGVITQEEFDKAISSFEARVLCEKVE